jgi:hypothetical protein
MNVRQNKVKNCRISSRFFDDLFQVALSINDLRAEAITCRVKITSSYNLRIWAF